MPNAITTHTIVNGTRNLILSLNMVADGTGNETDTTLIDLNDYVLEPGLRVPRDFAVKKISGLTGAGTTVKFFFGADSFPSRLFYETIADRPFEQEWVGGLITGQANTDLTIRYSTIGFDANLDVINLNIWIKKKY